MVKKDQRYRPELDSDHNDADGRARGRRGSVDSEDLRDWEEWLAERGRKGRKARDELGGLRRGKRELGDL
jgi:hypothetical protein